MCGSELRNTLGFGCEWAARYDAGTFAYQPGQIQCSVSCPLKEFACDVLVHAMCEGDQTGSIRCGKQSECMTE